MTEKTSRDSDEALSLDEAFAAGQLRIDGPPGAEALLVLGDSSGRIVHVADVPRGAGCGCLCPACRGPLIARHGEVRVWHFAHQSREQCDAAGAIAAAMRDFARQALEGGHGLRLPTLTARIGEREMVVVRGRSLSFDQVRVEKREGVTELLVTKAGRDLIVEFATRRRMSKKREMAIRDAGRSAIEIDLTAVVEEKDATVIRQAILHAAPRRWIFNLHAEQARQEMEREWGQEVQRRLALAPRYRREKLSGWSKEVFTYYASPSPPPSPAALSTSAWADMLQAAANNAAQRPADLGFLSQDPRPMLLARGMADLVGVLVPGCRAFAAEPGHWQGRILVGLIHAHAHREVRPEEICVRWTEIRTLLRPEYLQFEEAGAPQLDELVERLPRDAWPARRAIAMYLSFLAAKDVATRGQTGFLASQLAVERWARTTN